MFPKLPQFNLSDNGYRNAETSGNICNHAPAFKQVANDRNIVVDQLGVLLSHSANMTACFKAVLGVLFRGAPFKIFKTVVTTIVVNVIDLFSTLWGVADKRTGNHSVDKSRGGLIIATQSNLMVSVIVDSTTQDAGRSVSVSKVSSHSPQIRDRVHAFVPDNGQPNFVIKFFGGKVGISHLQKITPFVNRSGLKDYLRNLSACFYFTTPLTGGVR